jgi:MFS family permease
VFFNPILGVFAPQLEAEFDWSRASIAAAITIGSLAAAVVAPVTGWVVDRYGGRWVITAAGITMAIALVFLSGLLSLWQLYLFYAIGRGVSMSGVVSITSASWWSPTGSSASVPG